MRRRPGHAGLFVFLDGLCRGFGKGRVFAVEGGGGTFCRKLLLPPRYLLEQRHLRCRRLHMADKPALMKEAGKICKET